jgi:hypothetical protein
MGHRVLHVNGFVLLTGQSVLKNASARSGTLSFLSQGCYRLPQEEVPPFFRHKRH